MACARVDRRKPTGPTLTPGKVGTTGVLGVGWGSVTCGLDLGNLVGQLELGGGVWGRGTAASVVACLIQPLAYPLLVSAQLKSG